MFKVINVLLNISCPFAVNFLNMLEIGRLFSFQILLDKKKVWKRRGDFT